MFLGIDAGTTAMKAALFSQNGELIAVSSQEYTLETPKLAWVELDPRVYWQKCVQVIAEVLKITGCKPQDIQALAISSQAETLICLDCNGQPVRKAIVWLDNRAVEEAAEIAAKFSREEIYHTTGQPEVTATWPACKILWIRRNEPAIFAATAHFLLVEDYLLYQLTGELVTEFALESSSLLVDIQAKKWWGKMLDVIGISTEQLPPLVDPGQTVGTICEKGSCETGLSTRTIAVAGAIDQVIGAVGSGNIAPGIISETTGGALGIVATLQNPTFDPGFRIPCHFHALPDTYCLLPWGQTAGMALRWFRDAIYAPGFSRNQSDVDLYDQMTAKAALIAPGAEKLVFLPHLEGAACPEFNAAARGVFFGLTLRHTQAHMIRAILESVAFMLKKNLEIVESLGIDIKEIRSVGGGAKSDLWLQIKADVLQKPVKRVNIDEAACLGAAILASVAAGAYRDVNESASQMVHIGKTFYPNPDHNSNYLEGYRQYVRLYEYLEPMFQS